MTDTRKGANPYDDMSKRTSENRPNLGLMIGGATVAVIAIIAAVVFLWPSDDGGGGGGGGGTAEEGTGLDAAQNASQETGTVQISGEDLAPLEGSGAVLAADDPMVGETIPKLTGQSFDESEVVIDPDDGKPKLVVFLAHWCGHCIDEVPELQEWIDSGAVPEGLDAYAVSTNVDRNQANYPPSRWLASEGWTPPVLLDDNAHSAAASWGLTGTPYLVWVDAEGNVWQRASGALPIEDVNRLSAELVAGGSPTGVDPSSGEGEQTPVDLDAGGADDAGNTDAGATTDAGGNTDEGAN